jgi:hypothetical protein
MVSKPTMHWLKVVPASTVAILPSMLAALSAGPNLNTSKRMSSTAAAVLLAAELPVCGVPLQPAGAAA